MEFDTQNVDLDQLAEVARTGGIAALEEFANTGKVTEAPAEVEEAAEPNEAAAEDTEASDPKPAVEETPAATEPEPDKDPTSGVSTKDGKGVIPYSVLKGARERATQVEQQNDVLRKQLGELTQRMDNPATAAETAKTTDEVDAQIAAMREQADQLKTDFPELAGLFDGQLKMLVGLRHQLSQMAENHATERQEREATAQAEIAETMQEAIDGNPTLSAWKEKAGPEWAAAIEMDNLLRTKAEYADTSFAERFTKVVNMVRVMNPEFEAVETLASEPKPAPTPTSVESKPQAAASVKRPPVHSLSDIPGGVPPAAGMREQIEEMSASALGNKFQNMSLDQINEQLASLGT